MSLSSVNRVRGEETVEIDGSPRCLRLTLGALAEIETGLGVDGFIAVAERLASGRMRDVALVLAALVRAGGDAAIAERILDARIDPIAAAQAIARVFASAGAPEDETEAPGKP